jgi:tetratricopeptide (TPR) repeat protein
MLSARLADWGYSDLLLKQLDWSRYANAGGIRQALAISPEVMSDVVLSNLEYEELEAVGEARRVLVGMRNSPAETFYMVPESGSWRVLTLERIWEPVGREVLARLDAGDTTTARAWLELARDVMSGWATGENEWLRRYATALPRDAPATDVAAMRLAAYMLLDSGYGVSAKVAEFQTASQGAETDEQRTLWQFLIFWAAHEEGDGPAMMSAAERIGAAKRDASDIFYYPVRAHLRLGQWKEAERIAREWQSKDPANASARDYLVDALNGQGLHREALDLLAPAVRRRQANAGQLNLYAWQALLAGAIDDSAIQAAESAFQQRKRRDYASGHTLACVYAASGRIAESQKVLLEMREEIPDFDATSGDTWLIRGLIAEELGRTELAAKAYGMAEKPDWPNSDSSYAVASVRLAKLSSVGAAAQ